MKDKLTDINAQLSNEKYITIIKKLVDDYGYKRGLVIITMNSKLGITIGSITNAMIFIKNYVS